MPSILDCTIDELVHQAKELQEAGTDSFDILLYRYKYPEKINELITRVVREIKVPVVSAGSIMAGKGCRRQ